MAEVISLPNRLPGDTLPCPVLLIVDDDPDWIKLASDVCEQALKPEQGVVLSCNSIPEALAFISKNLVHAVVLDKNLGSEPVGSESDPALYDGIEAIPQFLKIQEHLQIVTTTSSEETQDVVQAILNGACTYVVKHKSMDYFVAAVRRALRTGLSLALAKSESEPLHEKTQGMGLPGKCPATVQLRLRVQEAAKTEAPVVLLGESGTGKSTIAQFLHLLRSQYLGKRPSDRPFVRLNMAAIPDALAESELFGHEGGAFTGAIRQKFGALERARGGTLFLDEIADASPSVQAKLLTALDEKKFYRLGGEQEVKSEFRLICATNRNLEQLMRQGKFREELYRRIAILEIKVPSVLERKKDMEEILRAILPKCCREARISISFEDIPEDFIKRLSDQPPSGNIGGLERQLIRLLAHAPRDRKDRPLLKQWRSIPELKMNGGEVIELPTRVITAEDFLQKPFDVVGKSGFSDIFKFLRTIEKKIYEDARRKQGSDYGSTKKIAQAFGISDAVVSRRLQEFGWVRSGRPETRLKKEGKTHECGRELQPLPG